ncbi:MAG TPA: hypothetical protein VFP63_01965 [Dehalococcoidia bacterium]|nr:hypothetical protein [Dehalococcoidia bacterium]
MIWLIVLGLILALFLGAWIIGQVMGFILMLVLAGIIGALVGSWLNYKGGVIFSVAAGLIGAVLGTAVANIFNLPQFPELFNLPLLWTTAGAAAVTAVGKVVMPDARQQARIGRIGRKMLR